MYNKFFFLHIDKTINVSVDINIMHSLYRIMERHGIDTSYNLKHSDHNRWRLFDQPAFIFTIFRNPLLRTTADFTQSMLYDEFGTRRINPHGAHVDDGFDPSLDDFEKWLYTFHTPNYQARSLFNGLRNVSHETITERLKEINLMVKEDDLYGQAKQNQVANKILSDLGINETIKVPWIPEVAFQERHANLFYHNKLKGTSLEAVVRDLNKSDLFIYESNFNL
jgi:hypothetical protein